MDTKRLEYLDNIDQIEAIRLAQGARAQRAFQEAFSISGPNNIDLWLDSARSLQVWQHDQDGWFSDAKKLIQIIVVTK